MAGYITSAIAYFLIIVLGPIGSQHKKEVAEAGEGKTVSSVPV